MLLAVVQQQAEYLPEWGTELCRSRCSKKVGTNCAPVLGARECTRIDTGCLRPWACKRLLSAGEDVRQQRCTPDAAWHREPRGL